MDLTTVTVSDFKTQFPRDFPYFSAIQYDNSALYNLGDEVFYAPTNLFYQPLVDGVTGIAPDTPTTGAQNWIKYADTKNNWAQDDDITRAFLEAQVTFNQTLFSSDAQIKMGYLYMTAYFMVNDLRAALNGGNGNPAFPVTGRTVGSVSESYTIPPVLLENILYAMYANNYYGLKYLLMVLPKLTGNMTAVFGGALP